MEETKISVGEVQFNVGDKIKHFGEKGVIDCEIIKKVPQAYYDTDRGITSKSFDYNIYTLKEDETGREFETVECGRFRLKNIIYEFLYNGCIHESSYATMSLHKTKAGAEKALNEHKEKAKVKHEKNIKFMMEEIKNNDDLTAEDKKVLLDNYDEYHKFGAHEDWAIGEQELLD